VEAVYRLSISNFERFPMPTRSSAGAELTCAGRAFERYALSNIRVWEEMGQQVAFRGIMQSGKTDNTRVGISL
jgi:hypothetical protein